MDTPIPLLLLLLSLTLVSAFTPADNYLINCGSTVRTITDPDHRTFTADSADPSPPSLSSPRSSSITNSNPRPDPNLSPIYHSARVFTKPSSYTFKINHPGLQLVRLHFHKFEFNHVSTTCHDQFHVSANQFVLLHNYSVSPVSKSNPEIKDFIIPIDNTDRLTITFIPLDKTSYAFVNAIEVISAPPDLIIDQSDHNTSPYASSAHAAYESVYRISVGGVKVTPFNDSLWRTWVPDDGYVKSGDGEVKGYKKIHFDGRINYRVGGASREVGPDNMYNSARLVTSSDGSVSKGNMTWVFPVRKGFRYLVRLHFCDIASISIGMIYFNVYVNGKLVYEDFDLSSVTNYMLASPYYADVVADLERDSDVIRVDIGASKSSMAHAVDGILNGVEIWKMSNSMGSLDGEVCVGQLEVRSRSGGQVSRLLSLTGAVCLLAVAFLVMRRKTGAKDAGGWSRVPSEIDLKSGYSKTSVVNV